MTRSSLVLVSILVLALGGGAVFFWLNPDAVTGLFNSAPTNTNTQVVTNTNSAPITSTAPELIEGDQKLTGSVKIGEVTVQLTGVTRTKNFESIDAGAGKVFVVVYFQSVAPNEVLPVKRGLESDSRLTSGTTIIELAGLKVASNIVTNDRGYLKFEVAEAAKNLQLEVGSGATVQKVVLP